MGRPPRPESGTNQRRCIDRRVMLGALASVPMGFLGTPPARAQSAAADGSPPLRFRAIAVDTSRIAELGGSAAAAALRQVLLVKLQGVFADRLAPADARAPTLVARITYLSMTSYLGNDGVDELGNEDNIEGDGIVTLGGRTLSSTHVLTTLSPAYSGAYYTPGIDRIRLESIAYQFAYWLRREMNL